jgi:hypothetical protein
MIIAPMNGPATEPPAHQDETAAYGDHPIGWHAIMRMGDAEGIER